MELATVNPLCDKDFSGMSPRELTIALPDKTLRAYVCNLQQCDHCYNEGSGCSISWRARRFSETGRYFVRPMPVRCFWKLSVLRRATGSGDARIAEGS